MIRRRLTLAAVCCTGLLGLGAPSTATTPVTPPAETMTLRLPDLPPGYEVESDIGCEGPTAPGRSETCRVSFTRAWTAPGTAPGPRFAMSAALVVGDADTAAARLAHPRATAAAVLDETRGSFEVIEHAPVPGDRGALLRADDGSAVVVWHSGAVIGLVLTWARKPDATLADAALRLATAQQARIAAPTSLAPTDFDDSVVPLDDPRLPQLYWLGRTLPPQGGRAALPLLEVERPSQSEARDGFGMTLRYGLSSAGATISLTLVDPSLLRRRAIRREVRRIAHDPCTVRDELSLPDGRATIFTGAARCPHYGDDVAIVRLPGVVVLVVPDGCQNCHGPVSRYQTRAGMRAVVRALRARQPATAPPAG